MKVCETCSTWFTEVAESCPACGALVAGIQSTTSRENQHWAIQYVLVAIWTVGVAGVIAAAVMLWA